MGVGLLVIRRGEKVNEVIDMELERFGLSDLTWSSSPVPMVHLFWYAHSSFRCSSCQATHAGAPDLLLRLAGEQQAHDRCS